LNFLKEIFVINSVGRNVGSDCIV